MLGFNFSKKVKLLLSIATLVMLGGYIVMATGDSTISIVLLTFSYLVLFPVAIMVGKTKNCEK